MKHRRDYRNRQAPTPHQIERRINRELCESHSSHKTARGNWICWHFEVARGLLAPDDADQFMVTIRGA